MKQLSFFEEDIKNSELTILKSDAKPLRKSRIVARKFDKYLSVKIARNPRISITFRNVSLTYTKQCF